MSDIKINVIIVILLLFVHWIADFVLQTDKQAKGKSKNWKDLLSHTLNYSLVFWILLMFITKGDTTISFYFWFITLVCHTIQDYFTSRLNSKLYSENKIHYFFVSIGFDQFLHYLQLIITYKILNNE